MFLFEAIPWYSWLMWVAILVLLMLFNEITRYNKTMGILFFIVLPIVLTLFVWPKTSGASANSPSSNWFAWIKVYSALIGCYMGLCLRFSKKMQKGIAPKWYYIFPPLILGLNILEAVIREFEVVGMDGVIDGMFYMGGPWNILNGIAGLLSLITICGWFGIIITKDKRHSLVWPDMMWFWIIAYDLWNFAYVYNCITDRSFYSIALLLSCTIPAFLIKKGAWAQHRVHTLALYMMFMMTMPNFLVSSKFAVASTHSPSAFYAVSIVSLIANLAVFAYQIYTMVKRKKNLLKDELYSHTKEYKNIIKENL